LKVHSDELTRAMTLYTAMMGEIKIRINSILELRRAGHFVPIPAQVLYESSYLQLRYICELIAMGCLVVHGDIPATKTKHMQKAYAADEIIKRLSEIHPNFYPHPVTAKSGPVMDKGTREGAPNYAPEE